MRQRLHQLGLGLITGAADDDPSGIATYSQAGAQFGYSMLWTVVFTLPLMAAIPCCGIRRVPAPVPVRTAAVYTAAVQSTGSGP